MIRVGILRSPLKQIARCGCSTSASTSRQNWRPEKGPRPAVYDSTFVESGWYDWWERSGQFRYQGDLERPFTMCLPPPNVTGDLHIGHALTVTIEDVLARWHRMQGRSVLWIPGYDHAGIATQVVVEKQLMRKKGLRRVDMSREKFVQECLTWKELKMDKIRMQLQRLGASLDWSRTYYTMDESFSAAVAEAFIRLYKSGLVFRGERLVNWCPFLKSTLSDIEVDRISINCDGKEATLRLPGRADPIVVGRLFIVRYPIANDPSQFVLVATTRPETIPADVALAVNPSDQRYAKYIGQAVKNPLLDADPIPIVADNQVDPSFGTGVLKVTPAHDWTDFDIGTRHRLPLNVRCLTEDGKLTERCGPDLKGLDRFDAREKVVGILRSRNLLADIKRQPQATLPLCSRTGDVVEPMLKEQWFINCRNMAAAVIKAVEDGKLKITPSFFEGHWRNWLSQSGDWCISRQLWWGHRVPAYRLRETSQWYTAKTKEDALVLAKGDRPEATANDLEQDEDVLDTWFSSALVPLVASEWPKRLDPKLYPLNIMETGHDILLFWVTRMAMMGLQLTGRLPFDEILLHGIVFDKRGRKMSKSLGNVVDPLDIIDGVELETLQRRLDVSSLPKAEIEVAKDAMKKEFPEGVLKCGADALRFMLLKQDVIGIQLNLDVNLILSGRKFCNKLWQAFTFMENSWKTCSEVGWRPEDDLSTIKTFKNFPVVEQWLLSRLASTVDMVNRCLEKYEFAVATGVLYEFFWFEFCDVYLEWTKFFLRPKDQGGVTVENEAERKKAIGDVLYLMADVYIRLLAPFMPFLTEELHERLGDMRQSLGLERMDWENVHKRGFPKVDELPFINEGIEKQMGTARKILDAARSIRIEFGLSQKDRLACVVFGDESSIEAAKAFNEFYTLLGKLTVKEYRSMDGRMSDLDSGHMWKSMDTNLLVAIELEQANREAVTKRLADQIQRLEKRKRDHRTRREKVQQMLAGQLKHKFQPAELKEQVETLERKIVDTDTELERLQKMHSSFSKASG